jgi:hypothetical protein
MMIRVAYKGLWAILSVLCSATCDAGGINWSFIVKEFTADDDSFVVTIEPSGFRTGLPESCKTLTVRGDYAMLYWLFHRGIAPSKEQHIAALSLLRDSFRSRSRVNFGWIGTGVNFKRGDGECTAISRGLTVEDSTSGQAIFSFYKWP